MEKTIIERFEPHSHTELSNLRLLDCINKVESLIDRAVEIGLSGIAITDHECLSSFVRAKKHEEKIRKINPNFKVVLGNEIYLCEEREIGQPYYHFSLLAKNKDGYMALKKLSSTAWMNSYYDRRMERVVTRYDDLKEVLKEYPNSLIGTTACLGGELSSRVKQMIEAEARFNTDYAKMMHDEIVRFMLFCKDLFGDDFYIECAPGQSREQIAVNKRLQSIAKAFDVKMVIGTDAHYLKKEDRYVHKAYLNSKGGEREVDAFYEFSYLQTEDEIIENLTPSFEDAATAYQTMCENSIEIFNKIEDYSIFHKQVIPSVDLPFDYLKNDIEELNNYPILKSLFNSDDKVERYWVNQCWTALEEKIGPWQEHLDYVARLEEEAGVKKIIGEKLETNMFSYPVTLQHYVDLFWKCGSIVGAGRGSSCSGLNHYLLGITQLDPIQWDLPFWRLELLRNSLPA